MAGPPTPGKCQLKGAQTKVFVIIFYQRSVVYRFTKLENPEILKYVLKILNPRTAGF